MADLRRLARLTIAPTLAVAALSFTTYRSLEAADHLDSPARTDPAVDPSPDKAADIADVYVFFDATNYVIAMTFAGPQSTALPASYDRNVLYTINLSNAGDRTDSEYRFEVRYGKDASGNDGVQFTGLPGTSGPVSGPVEQNLDAGNGVLVRSGLVDDPFFFDLVGFRASRAMGSLQFNNQRNFFAGQNITSIVIQIPRSLVENGDHPLDVWATSSRLAQGEL